MILVMWGAMGEYVSLNSINGNIEKNSGIVWMATMFRLVSPLSYSFQIFSNVLSGFFLLVMFLISPSNSYTLSLIRLIFGTLTGLASLGRPLTDITTILRRLDTRFPPTKI